MPFFTIVLRKGYGLGAQAMAGASFKAPVFTVAWPTGEFGGMGLEGAVRLGYRKELEAVEDPGERKALFDEMVARMYEHGKALNTASHFEIDDVIDPVAVAPLDSDRAPLGAAARAARGQEAPEHRHVVNSAAAPRSPYHQPLGLPVAVAPRIFAPLSQFRRCSAGTAKSLDYLMNA